MGSATAALDPPSSSSCNHRLPLRPDSLPVVDLRLLSQSDLLTLSLASTPSSSHHHHHADVFSTPKIDRSVFNESAASRKQTYSRLRLAPNASVAAARRSRAPDPTPDPDPLLGRDAARVFALLELLFGPDAIVPVAAADPAQPQSLPLVAAAGSAPEKPKRGRPRKNSSGTVDLPNRAPVTSGLVPCGSASEKRKRGRPRKTPEGASFEVVPYCSVPCGSDPGKKKRGRPRKNPIAFPGGSGYNPQQGFLTESTSTLTNTAPLEHGVVEAEQPQGVNDAELECRVIEAEQWHGENTVEAERWQAELEHRVIEAEQWLGGNTVEADQWQAELERRVVEAEQWQAELERGVVEAEQWQANLERGVVEAEQRQANLERGVVEAEQRQVENTAELECRVVGESIAELEREVVEAGQRQGQFYASEAEKTTSQRENGIF